MIHGFLETFEETILIGDMATAPLPSLLGWDLLRRLRLEIDGEARTVSMDRPL